MRVVPQPMNWNLNLFKQGWRYYEVRILVDATLTGLGTRITDKQLNNYQYQWFTTSEVQGRVVTVYAVGDSEEMAYSEARKFVRLLQQAGAAI